MTDRGTQLALTASLPEDLIKSGGNTYTPFVYVPVSYGEGVKPSECTGTGTVVVPTEGQLWPRGNAS